MTALLQTTPITYSQPQVIQNHTIPPQARSFTESKIRDASGHYEIPKDGISPGGRLTDFLQYWKDTTNHPWPLSVVSEGYRIQWTKTPIPWTSTPMKMSTEEQTAVDLAVNNFLRSEIIERSPTQNEGFLSNFFTIQEPNKRRPILDCKRINTFVQCSHFKMEGVPALRDIIRKDVYLCKIDLKDAYVVVPIHPLSRQFLSFRHQGAIYQYKTLAFGLSVAPRVLSKLMRYAIEPLRKLGIRMVYYLDDLCVVAKTKEGMKTNTQTILDHLQKLGFLINWEKSQLDPKYTQEFLGFKFQTQSMTIKVPKEKMKNLAAKLRQLQTSTSPKSCRWIASLIGKMTAMIPAIGDALLHTRYLQRDLAKSLETNHHQWERPCTLTARSQEDVSWWLKYAQEKNGLAIRKHTTRRPSVTIYVDASDTGWGVSSTMVNTHGFWTKTEKEVSINVRELKTILFALQLHKEKFRNCAIKILSDSMTALKYVKKSGGTASIKLQELAIEIQDLCNNYQLELDYHHIPGIQNTLAGKLSRKNPIPPYEKVLPFKWFNKIQKQWGPLKIDAFAGRHNRRLKHFWSLFPDPEAKAVDAFRQTWPKKGIYLNPPWKFIPKVLHKLRTDKVKEAVLVTPLWPTQCWWPLIITLTKEPPILMKLTNRWTLAAWRLFPRREQKHSSLI